MSLLLERTRSVMFWYCFFVVFGDSAWTARRRVHTVYDEIQSSDVTAHLQCVPAELLEPFHYIPSVLNALGVDNENDNIQSSTASASKELSDTDHNELLMGYGLLTDIFTAQSQLWLVPILRKLARGTPLVIEISDLIHKLVKSGKYHKKQLLSKKNGLRNLQPNVSRHFIDTNPNKLIDEMGKNIVCIAHIVHTLHVFYVLETYFP